MQSPLFYELRGYWKIGYIHVSAYYFGQYERLLLDPCFCFEFVTIDLLIF